MPLAHSMGQYCYLNIPRISRLEWHPFTISSAPVDMVTTHHIKVTSTSIHLNHLALTNSKSTFYIHCIKVMGGYDPSSSTQQWTAKLYALAEELQRLRSMPRVDYHPPTPALVMSETTRIPLRGENLGTLRDALLSNNGANNQDQLAAFPGTGYLLPTYLSNLDDISHLIPTNPSVNGIFPLRRTQGECR